MYSVPRNDLDLGLLAVGKTRLLFSRVKQDEHLYICGGTKTGEVI